MERFSRMLRSGLAMMLALCMIVSACPVIAFANEGTAPAKKYVSLGDSMASGYGLTDYHDPYEVNGFMDFVADAYPNQLKTELQFNHIAHLIQLGKVVYGIKMPCFFFIFGTVRTF